MERKRVKGRFVREGLDGDGGAKRKAEGSVAGKVAAPRPKYCRTFTRARIAEALPQIVEKFTEEAAKGSIAHTKVLMKIGGLDTGDVAPKTAGRRGKSVVRLLLENLKDLDEERPRAVPSSVEEIAGETLPESVNDDSGSGVEQAG
jgi:hypothetical protein